MGRFADGAGYPLPLRRDEASRTISALEPAGAIVNILKKVRAVFSPAYRRRLRELKPVHAYLAASPDNNLLLLHNLPSNAVVMDIGGFTGEWTARMAQRYDARIYVFEPVPHFVDVLRQRFAGNPRVVVCDYGVGGSDQNLRLSLDGDASSAFRQSATTIEVPIRAFGSILREHGIERVDLIALNAEGAEFDLLPALLDSGDFARIDRLLVQFHRVLPDAEARRAAIQAKLSTTHEKMFDFPFCWEYWARKPQAK